ncbi:MAG: adenosylcobinamide-phosphate synthase CbiB, partial [Spirochaetota bacterium]
LEQVKQFLFLPLGINLVSAAMVYFLLCNRDMIREAKSVYILLEKNDLEGARRRVSRIVGRQTDSLDRKEIIRAAVESVAENLVDGFISPLFYLVLGGAPLGYLYKTVNTFDSMFGYKSEKYLEFGKAGARADDVLNFIPARLNVLFMLTAGGFRRSIIRTVIQHGKKHPSPNAGLAEAGFSGFLGIALGGPSVYSGEMHNKQWIGENRLSAPSMEDPGLILKAVSYYWKVVYLSFGVFLAAVYFLGLPVVFG